jgi:hypothetical protein
MTVVVVENKVTKDDIEKASEEYGEYIKIVIDVKTGLTAIGGEWHADGERKLLESGSKQENIWGGGIDIKTKKIDFNALINIRSDQENDSMEILDLSIKTVFTKIVKEKFGI